MGYTETFAGRSAIGFFPDPIVSQPRTLEQQVTNRPKTYPQKASQSLQLFFDLSKTNDLKTSVEERCFAFEPQKSDFLAQFHCENGLLDAQSDCNQPQNSLV